MNRAHIKYADYILWWYEIIHPPVDIERIARSYEIPVQGKDRIDIARLIGQQYFTHPSGINEFAASLLVPFWMLDPLAFAHKPWIFWKPRYTIPDLANIFKVSLPIMEIRILDMLCVEVKY